MIVGALGLSTGLDAAVAAPLDQPACEALKTEQTTLASSGVEADWQKGADWGKSNASPDRLKEIERYIAITEQLSFRCRWLPASEQAKRAGEIADKLAKNPDTDPLAPPETPASADGKPKSDAATGAGAAMLPSEKGAATATKNARPSEKLPSVTRLKKKTRAEKAKEAAKAKSAANPAGIESGDAATDAAPKSEKPEPKNDAYVPPLGSPQSTLTAPGPGDTKLPWADTVAPTPVMP